MALNKADLINSVMEKVHLKNQGRERQQYLFPELNYTLLSRKRAADIVDSMLELIKITLEKGEDVLISGFGKFCIKQKKERRGRNPATGDDMMLTQRRVVTFRCSHLLREKINH